MNDNSPINALIREYDAWNKVNGLNLGSADEHHHDESLTAEQRTYVRSFSRRWESAEELEALWADAEREAFA